MRCQRQNATFRAQDSWCSRFPERGAGNVGIEDMVDGHCLCGNQPPRVDEERAALIVETPAAIIVADDILPSDLSDVIRAVASRLKINHPNSGFLHRYRFFLPTACREANDFA